VLIEGAFYKLSDYFQSIESPGELYEQQVSFIFAVAIFQEFQARGFPYLLSYIQLNRKYPVSLQKEVDIYVKIPESKLPPEILHRWANSGVCEENWIEVKFFGGAERKQSSERKTRNLGELLEDLLRLKFYVQKGGKYLLLVFNRKPEYYLPFKMRKEGKKRDYIPYLLRHGRDLIKIDFNQEPQTVINSISPDLRNLINQKKGTIEFDLQKHSIEPILVKGLISPVELGKLRRSRIHVGVTTSEPVYYFYLLRILETFRI